MARLDLLRTRLLALAAVTALSVGATLALDTFSPVRTFVVSSDSMEPAIPVGSMVWVRVGEQPELGDAVVFESPLGGPFVHRVIEMTEAANTTQYVTKGDNLADVDSILVRPVDVIGRVTHVEPDLGKAWLMPKTVAIGLFGGAVIAYLALALLEASRVRQSDLLAALLVAAVLASPAAGAGMEVQEPASTTTANLSSGHAWVPGPAGATTVSQGGHDATVNITPESVGIWKEVVLWACHADQPGEAGCQHTLPATWTDVLASSHRLQTYSPNPTLYLEATLAAPSGGLAQARLVDTGTSNAVTGSEVSTSATSPTLLRSSAISLTAGSDYAVSVQASPAGGSLTSAKLLVYVENATTLSTVVPIAGGDKASGDVSEEHDRGHHWVYEPSSGETAVELVVWASASDKGMRVEIVDVATQTRVVEIKDPQGSPGRYVKDLTGLLTAGEAYMVKHRTSIADAELHTARIIITQTNPATTWRYVHLGYGGSLNATAYADLHGQAGTDSNEAPGNWTLAATGQHTTDVGRIRLLAGATVAAEVQAFHGTMARHAVAAAVLPGNRTLQLQAEVDSGTLELRGAWLRANQAIATHATFDYVLEVSSAGCTWNYWLAVQASSNVGRLENLQIWFDNGTGAQVHISQGVIHQATGVAEAHADGLQHIVMAATSSAGSSTLEVEQHASCGGLHRVQFVTYNVG